jgi:DNA-binding response OmpR family regulator
MDKILVVDAYPSVRELLAEELAGEGHMVVAIGNPVLIAGLLDTFDPDLIVLDLYISGKMRWNVLKEIKRQKPQLPVVIFTSSYPERNLRFPRVEGWVIKTYLLDELKEKINEVLKRRILLAKGPKKLIPSKIKRSDLFGHPSSNIQLLGRSKREWQKHRPPLTGRPRPASISDCELPNPG